MPVEAHYLLGGLLVLCSAAWARQIRSPFGVGVGLDEGLALVAAAHRGRLVRRDLAELRALY